MQLTTHQLTTQEAILKRLYPGVSIEEIRKKEEKIKGCIVYKKGEIRDYRGIGFGRGRGDTRDFSCGVYNDEEVIGLPPTLTRILTALGDDFEYLQGYIRGFILDDRYNLIKKDIPRQLLNEDMTDKNLWEQEQETQDILYSIFVFMVFDYFILKHILDSFKK